MPDMGSITAALGGLKAASELAKAIIQIKSEVDRNAKVIELQSVILSAQSSAIAAQSEQFAMLEEVRKAKEEVAAMKDWDAEKKRYKLATPYSGVTVFALQKAMSNGEPPHYLCANCFRQAKQSVIANSTNKEGWVALVCSACKFTAQTRWRGLGPAKYAEEITTED